MPLLRQNWELTKKDWEHLLGKLLGLRQVAFGLSAAAITYGIGILIGVSLAR